MDLKKRLETCTKCEKRKFGDTGTVCSLTGQKPTFITTCNDFKLDPKEAQRIAARLRHQNYNSNANTSYQREESSTNPIWFLIGLILAIIKIFLMFR